MARRARASSTSGLAPTYSSTRRASTPTIRNLLIQSAGILDFNYFPREGDRRDPCATRPRRSSGTDCSESAEVRARGLVGVQQLELRARGRDDRARDRRDLRQVSGRGSVRPGGPQGDGRLPVASSQSGARGPVLDRQPLVCAPGGEPQHSALLRCQRQPLLHRPRPCVVDAGARGRCRDLGGIVPRHLCRFAGGLRHLTASASD